MNNTHLILSDTNSIFNAINTVAQNQQNNPDIDYKLEFNNILKIRIKLKGCKFDCTLTGQVIKGLGEFQDEIYRAVAYTLYGEANIRKLTAEELSTYNLVFKLEQGSTAIAAAIDKLVEGVLEALKDMDSKHKVITICSIALMLTGGYVANNILEQKIQSEKQIKLQQEYTKQIELLTHGTDIIKLTKVWDGATQNAIKAIAKRLDENDSMEYGDYLLSAEAIKEIKRKNPRTTADDHLITDDFVLHGFKDLQNGQTQFEIRGASGEYSVLVDTDTFSSNEISTLSHMAADRKKVKLTIKLTIIRGKIKAAYLEDFENVQN